eukprot:7795522-Lingulodinium_polyedra.AAC.1
MRAACRHLEVLLAIPGPWKPTRGKLANTTLMVHTNNANTWGGRHSKCGWVSPRKTLRRRRVGGYARGT